MKNILVTGINGFVGKHLAKELIDNGFTVVAVGGKSGSNNSDDVVSDIKNLDLTNVAEVETIDFKNIDAVIHLAGLSSVGESFDNVLGYINTNVGIEANLFEAALKQDARPKFLIISSGSLYSPNQEMPIIEESIVLPSSPYAVSKLGQEQLAEYYALRGFECIIVRPFNHIGPGQNTGFIVPDLVRQVLSVSEGTFYSVQVGNLATKRDYTDVRDIVRAYRLLLEGGKSGEIYNICSGKALSGQNVLDVIQGELDCNPKVVVDESKIRPSDPELIFGNCNKLKDATGWEPKIDIKTSISDVIVECRNKN